MRSREVRCMHVQYYRALPTLVRDERHVKRSVSDNAVIVTQGKMLSCIEVHMPLPSCRTGVR
ncbi:MAG TPA: hypothetical protein VET30_03565 [Pseudoxanthomonas sp.]|nr:hypothetical protein [Pseudoxanthomonas sp.]